MGQGASHKEALEQTCEQAKKTHVRAVAGCRQPMEGRIYGATTCLRHPGRRTGHTAKAHRTDSAPSNDDRTADDGGSALRACIE
eukprot:15444041-Alexandrium_andersonii.AAC.1